MPMTHGFADIANKLTGHLDPLHPAFSGRFTAYSGILGRSRVRGPHRRASSPDWLAPSLVASAIRSQIVPRERANGETWPTAYRLPTSSQHLRTSGRRARSRP